MEQKYQNGFLPFKSGKISTTRPKLDNKKCDWSKGRQERVGKKRKKNRENNVLDLIPFK